jgi:hypothetical protein
MEMIKYVAFAAAVVVSLVAADLAQARGHRGCSSCCSNGTCAVTYAPAKGAAVTGTAPAVVSTQPAAPAVVATPAPYYSTARRGIFGWRR